MNITENVNNLIKEIESLDNKVTIVAASKTQGIDNIAKALLGGITVFGENRVQELIEKFGKINVNWHFIGHLQTNKVKQVVGKVDLIHSVDSKKLLDEIDKCADRLDLTQKVLLELNIGREESKSGVLAENFDELYSYAISKKNVNVVGIMSVMPINTDEELYLQLKEIYDRIRKENENIAILSCGMSGDYKTAIRYGSNMIRIGTKIFGKR